MSSEIIPIVREQGRAALLSRTRRFRSRAAMAAMRCVRATSGRTSSQCGWSHGARVAGAALASGFKMPTASAAHECLGVNERQRHHGPDEESLAMSAEKPGYPAEYHGEIR